MPDAPQEAGNRPGRGAWIALAAAVVVVSAFRLHRLDLPLERDEGEYAYGAQLLSAGEFTYERLRTMKLPGTHAATAAFFAVFGETKEAMRGGLVLLNAANMLLVFLIGRRIFAPRMGAAAGAMIGAAAAASFGVLALNHRVLGLYAHAEHFALPGVLLGTLLLHRTLSRDDVRELLAAGACFGIGLVMKQQAAVFLLFALLVAAAPMWQPPSDVGRGLKRLGLVLGGVAVPPLLVGALFLASGSFDSFWLWTNTLAREYASTIGVGHGMSIFAEQAGKLFGGAPLVWMLAIGGAAVVFVDARFKPQRWFLGCFAAGAFLAVCPGFYFREHYFVFFLPAAALFVGAAVEWTVHFGQRTSSAPRPTQTAIGAGLACVLASPAIGQSGYLFTLEPERVSRSVYAENPFGEMVRIGEFLRERSRPGDLVAVLGSEPELNFYCGRRSPTGHIYMYPLMEANPHALPMQRQMIAEIEAAKPRWIVSCGEWLSWMIQDGVSHEDILEWGARYTAEHYRLVALAEVVTETETVYRFDADVASYAPTTERFVLVFERAN